MPYPAPHRYVTWFGDAYSSQEEWQVGIRFTGTGAASVPQLEALDEAFATLINTSGTQLPGGRRYLGLKVAQQTTAGRYPDGVDAQEFLRATPFEGPASTGYPQIALALSWRTARSRGYASNGRMYLPSSIPIDSVTGQISLGNANTARDNAAAFITALYEIGIGEPVVASTVGAGRFEPITAVRVGRVMDTQRRRRNQLPEGYTEPTEVPL